MPGEQDGGDEGDDLGQTDGPEGEGGVLGVGARQPEDLPRHGDALDLDAEGAEDDRAEVEAERTVLDGGGLRRGGHRPEQSGRTATRQSRL